MKVHRVPLEGRANSSQEAVEIGNEQNVFTKSIITKYFQLLMEVNNCNHTGYGDPNAATH